MDHLVERRGQGCPWSSGRGGPKAKARGNQGSIGARLRDAVCLEPRKEAVNRQGGLEPLGGDHLESIHKSGHQDADMGEPVCQRH